MGSIAWRIKIRRGKHRYSLGNWISCSYTRYVVHNPPSLCFRVDSLYTFMLLCTGYCPSFPGASRHAAKYYIVRCSVFILSSGASTKVLFYYVYLILKFYFTAWSQLLCLPLLLSPTSVSISMIESSVQILRVAVPSVDKSEISPNYVE